jgi:hypothetical protein
MNYNKSEKTIFAKNETLINDYNATKVNHNKKYYLNIQRLPI